MRKKVTVIPFGVNSGVNSRDNEIEDPSEISFYAGNLIITYIDHPSRLPSNIMGDQMANLHKDTCKGM